MPQWLDRDIIPGTALNNPGIASLQNELYEQSNITVSMLRLDEIHPVLSGNKLFKLYYFLEEAKYSSHKKVITFGGAYSNHLAATAFAFNKSNVTCIGIIRGEKPPRLSATLQFCIENGMQLEFISREAYRKTNEQSFLLKLTKEFGEHLLIPEGGFSSRGAKGAALITGFFNEAPYTHVCLAAGTCTTFAGLINGCNKETEIIGFSVLKNMNDIETRLKELQVNPTKKFSFIDKYHFGGYAKKTNELIFFMNDFYRQHLIPLDFVYTAKMMFGVNDLINKQFFPPFSNLLCLHTGGLQGNNSLPEGLLHF